jgi:hypothetical protein
MTVEACPVCRRLDAYSEWFVINVELHQARKFFECKRCGRFVIDDWLARIDFDTDEGKLLRHISSFLRRHQTNTNPFTPPSITGENWRELALIEKSATVPQKLAMLLQLISDRTSFLGETIILDPEIDGPLFNALNVSEVDYMLSALSDRQFVDLGGNAGVKMKTKGWEQIMPQPSSGGIPGQCFVAMWFDPEMDAVFSEGIYPAAKACNFKAIRIDEKPHNGDINDAILAEVKRCQFVIADFTGHRAGVYFEAGFARGLGRDVIWCCRESDFKQSHFDTNHYSHVVWKDIPDLKKKLKDRILATIPNARAVE